MLNSKGFSYFSDEFSIVFQVVWDGHFVSVPAQTAQRFFRAAPVAWRNEQNYTLRRTSWGGVPEIYHLIVLV